MKFSKVAAVMAGSVIAVGVAAPAFADTVNADNMSTMPTSINGGVDQALNEQPLQKIGDSAQVGNTLQALGQATNRLRGDTSADALVGQASVALRDAATSTLAGAVPGASLLGGLPIGGVANGVGGLAR